MGLRSQNNPIASFRDVFSSTGTDAVNPYVEPSGLTATGGVISDYTESNKVYRAHIFTSSGTFEVTEPGSFGDTLEYLVVAGGGAGGGWSGSNGGGGGGAGGLRTNLEGHPRAAAVYPVSTGQYTVICGAGGAIQASPAPGKDGSNSEFHPTPQNYPSPSFIRSIGGGGGGYNPSTGRTGGSSGGGAAPTNSIVGGNTPTDPNHPQPQGHAGGHGGNNVSRGGGGGGGAAGDGGNCSGPFPGGYAGYGGLAMQVLIGGPSSDSPIGTPGPSGQGWFAGGGAGADESFPDAKRGIGGRGNDRNATTPWGGGGNGAPGIGAAPGPLGCNALDNTGGGGGGGRNPGGTQGNGGSGIVVVRYQIGQLTAQAKATGGAISFFGGKTIHTFTSSGTFTVPGTFNETIRYAAIGGGGGGGVQHGGGGGAGGYRTADIPLNAAGSTVNVPVVIGAGGAGMGPKGSLVGTAGGENNGNDTVVSFPSPVTAGKGGGGAQLGPPSGSPAGVGASVPLGSGGGGGMHQPGNNANNFGSGGTNGNPGGRGSTYGENGHGGVGGGGGGAGGAGGGGSDSNPDKGKGGVGVQLHPFFRDPAAAPSATTPTEPRFAGERGGGLGTPGPNGQFYVGGGGGGAGHTPWGFGVGPDKAGGDGGFGGGGHGGTNSPGSEPEYWPGTNAVANTGGGGGAAGPHTVPGGSGGSGIVLIAYPTT